jgi:transcriptional regulator with XRE-family HTH domain
LVDFWNVAKQSVKQRYSKKLKNFGANVRRIRRSKDITQEELADESGISINSINTVEKGVLNPTFATILAIAEGLKVSPKDLFDPF